jgi:MFS family permease
LDHDAEFLSESAIGSMAATAATGVYMLALALLCPRLPVGIAIPLGLLAWLATAATVRVLTWDIVSAAAFTAGALIMGMALTVDERGWSAPKAGPRQWYDIPLRALLVATLVAQVTSFSHALGSEATGYAAVFPIAMTSLALILHLRQGGRAVAAVMASSFLPMLGFVLALIALHVVAPIAGASWGLAAALSGSILWSVLLLIWRFWVVPVPINKQKARAI